MHTNGFRRKFKLIAPSHVHTVCVRAALRATAASVHYLTQTMAIFHVITRRGVHTTPTTTTPQTTPTPPTTPHNTTSNGIYRHRFEFYTKVVGTHGRFS